MLGRPPGSSAIAVALQVFASHRLGGDMTQTVCAPGPRTIRVLLLLTSVTWVSTAGAQAAAQAGTIAGTTIDARSGLPLPDVTISVDGATSAARSGTRGEFRLTNVPGTTARLHA